LVLLHLSLEPAPEHLLLEPTPNSKETDDTSPLERLSSQPTDEAANERNEQRNKNKSKGIQSGS
jgi:hypothetical protein